MRYETAEISLIGNRDQNQDRVAICHRGSSLLLLVVDGMGGHAEGALAAQVATESLLRSYDELSGQIENPGQFLTDSVERAHDEVASLGSELAVQDKPRATCAVCLIVGSTTWWAHVGDSRIYLIRSGQVIERTRDHSHVEVLLREGVITEEEIHGHPMRHYVECCLGGESALPDLSSPDSFKLEPGDVLLTCTDGFWSGIPDDVMGEGCNGVALDTWLGQLSEQAVAACAPHSDNTTAAVAKVI